MEPFEFIKRRRVGYKNPPEGTRFRPGRSGNPRGRPRGSKNHDSLMIQLLKQPVRSAGGDKSLPRLEVLVEGVVDRALLGETRALATVFRWMQEVDSKPEPVPPPRWEEYFDLEAILKKLESFGPPKPT